MCSRWQGICLSAVAWLLLAGVCHAQNSSVSPEDEYRKAIKVSEDIQPLGENPFGEQISLYNGGLSFSQTDVSLPGNGPTMQLSRTFNIEGRDEFFTNMQDHAFGDWEIDIPRIETVTAYAGSLTSWQTSGTAQPDAIRNQRCTHFEAPPAVHFTGDATRDDWSAYEWWNGYHLIVPGAGDQELLPRSSFNTLSPTMEGKTFSIVTKQHWEVSCLGQTFNHEDEPGEAFFAVAPDGTKYWFNYLVYRNYPSVKKALGSGVGPSLDSSPVTGPQPNVFVTNVLARRKAWMLVTRIEDRFGNALTYHYAAGRLTSIDASDGRQLTVTYDAGSPRVHQVTLSAQAPASPRTWTYDYVTALGSRLALHAVTLPDGHAWSFNLAGLLDAKLDFENPASSGNCYIPSSPGNLGTPFSGSITQPSGLTGTFTIEPVAHGRSGVARNCWNVTIGPNVDGYAITPSLWYAFSLVSKQITGAGLYSGRLSSPGQSGQVTTYSYSAPNNSWSVDCPTTTSCASTVTTDVLDPEGHATRYTFSNRYDYTESLLLQTDYYKLTRVLGTPLRSEENHYAAPTTGPWPSRIGVNLQDGKENPDQTSQLFPMDQRTIVQDGDTYTWQAEAFDTYASVTKTKRYNTIAGQQPIEETTSYRNDPQLWVLGLPLKVTNLTTGEIESSNMYAGNDTLLTRSRFGQTLMNYTFNGAGQLASFKDGNNSTTTLGNYKRGIPQTINYPDGTQQALAVDDFGQIRSITDQLGSVTNYGYDSTGRLTSITYPAGDDVAWYPKSLTYSFVTTAERGIPANHWKRTTTTGNAQSVTYFDAMLRPILSDSAIGSSIQSSTLVNYDTKGHEIFTSYPSATALTFSSSPAVDGSTTTYDALGRVTRVAQDSEQGTLTSTTAYLSGAGQQTRDPKGNLTTTRYQVFDAPAYDAVIRVQAPAGVTQTIARDLYGNPLSITQSGLYGSETNSVTKTLVYDAQHRLCRTTEPESGSTLMHYDDANNLDWSATGLALDLPDTDCWQEPIAPAAKTTRTYDAMNRVRLVNYPSGEDTAFTYDLRGGLATTQSGLTTWTYARDARGLLTKETLGIDGYLWPVSYGYDRSGALATVTYPDGQNVAYAPDALGRPAQAGTYANGVSYFPDGDVKHFTYADGTEYLAEKNTRQLLSNLSYANAGLRLHTGDGNSQVKASVVYPPTPMLLDFSQDYSYDANANLTGVTDLVDGQRDKTFSYDALNRLTQATADHLWGTESYTYDALNNMRSMTSDGLTRTYQYDDTLNLLSAIKNGSTTLHSFGYDPRGNTTQKDTTSRQFDPANRLTQVVGVASYTYDAAGRRVKLAPVGGTPTYSIYNQAGQLMAQFAQATSTMTDYVHLGSRLVAEVDTTLDVMNAPAAPASITVPATSTGNLTVSWSASSAASSYTLQQRLDSGSWGTVYAGSALSKSLSVATSGSYAYQVQACNVRGCSAYKVSTAVTVTVTPPPTNAPDLAVPTTSSTGSYTVSWSGVPGQVSYSLQEQVNGGVWATIQSDGSTSRAISDKPDGSYGYRVQACNVGGCGPWSAVKTVSVARLPAVPTGLNIVVQTPSSKGFYTVSFNAVSGASRYDLNETTESTGDTRLIDVGTETSKGFLQINTDDRFDYTVRACSASGCSAWSDPVTVEVHS